MKSLEDLVQYVRLLSTSDAAYIPWLILSRYNNDNTGSEGGSPGINPAFGSGQDGFLASLNSKGIMNETYYQALTFCQWSTREGGIDAALNHDGLRLDGLLVPPDVGQTYQIAAQAGKPFDLFFLFVSSKLNHQGYPMITIPAGVNRVSGMPYGLAIMDTAWSEGALIKWASAIEDLQLSTNTSYKRTLPRWLGYKQRNIPVINA